MTPYRIVLADDHVLVRQGLKKIIAEASDLQVVGEANDGLELLALLRRQPAALVILDISMPRLRGIETIHEMSASHPHVKIIVLTMHREKEYVFEAMAAGASGYVLKEDADVQLFSAITKVRQGGVYVSPRLCDEVTHDWAAVRRRNGRPAPEGERLTIREREVLKLTAEGRTSKEIAGVLYVSYRTVEHHRASLMTKLDLKGIADVVKYAISNGYLEPIDASPSRPPRR